MTTSGRNGDQLHDQDEGLVDAALAFLGPALEAAPDGHERPPEITERAAYVIHRIFRGTAPADGVLKLAAPPQTIESVLSGFLPRYAERFPNVRGKLTEALGIDQVPLLERGEVHIGIRHDQGVNPWFESFALPSDDVLAACRPSLPLTATA